MTKYVAHRCGLTLPQARAAVHALTDFIALTVIDHGERLHISRLGSFFSRPAAHDVYWLKGATYPDKMVLGFRRTRSYGEKIG